MGKKTKKQTAKPSSPPKTRSQKGKGKSKVRTQAPPSPVPSDESAPDSPELTIHPDHESDLSSGDEGPLASQLAQLKSQKEKLEGKARRQKMRQEIASMRKEIAQLEAGPSTRPSTSGTSQQKSKVKRSRRDNSTERPAHARSSPEHDFEYAMRLHDEFEDGRRSEAWQSDSDTEEWSKTPAIPTGKHHINSGRQKRSGLTVKAADIVVHPQIWPHTSLQDEFASKGIEFNDLDFRLFIAGELETVTGAGIGRTERTGRLRLLKQLVYLKGSYDWETLKHVYVAIVRKIELDRAAWSDDFVSDIQWMVTKYMTQPRTAKWRGKSSAPAADTKQNSDNTWYCAEFQQGRCKHTDHHIGHFRGQTVTLHHICARCWRRHRTKAAHAEAVCKTE